MSLSWFFVALTSRGALISKSGLHVLSTWKACTLICMQQLNYFRPQCIPRLLHTIYTCYRLHSFRNTNKIHIIWAQSSQCWKHSRDGRRTAWKRSQQHSLEGEHLRNTRPARKSRVCAPSSGEFIDHKTAGYPWIRRSLRSLIGKQTRCNWNASLSIPRNVGYANTRLFRKLTLNKSLKAWLS